MKNRTGPALVVHAIFSLAFSASAKDYSVPQGQCPPGFCSAPQEKIWNAFQMGHALDASTVGAVFSGPCYHRSPDYNPNEAHYGAIFLNLAQGQAHFSGVFGFFFPENPYANLTPATAAQKMIVQTGANSLLHAESDQTWVDFYPEELTPFWLYHLRQNGDAIELIGSWDTDWTLFCELHRNGTR